MAARFAALAAADGAADARDGGNADASTGVRDGDVQQLPSSSLAARGLPPSPRSEERQRGRSNGAPGGGMATGGISYMYGRAPVVAATSTAGETAGDARGRVARVSPSGSLAPSASPQPSGYSSAEWAAVDIPVQVRPDHEAVMHVRFGQDALNAAREFCRAQRLRDSSIEPLSRLIHLKRGWAAHASRSTLSKSSRSPPSAGRSPPARTPPAAESHGSSPAAGPRSAVPQHPGRHLLSPTALRYLDATSDVPTVGSASRISRNASPVQSLASVGESMAARDVGGAAEESPSDAAGEEAAFDGGSIASKPCPPSSPPPPEDAEDLSEEDSSPLPQDAPEASEIPRRTVTRANVGDEVRAAVLTKLPPPPPQRVGSAAPVHLPEEEAPAPAASSGSSPPVRSSSRSKSQSPSRSRSPLAWARGQSHSSSRSRSSTSNEKPRAAARYKRQAPPGLGDAGSALPTPMESPRGVGIVPAGQTQSSAPATGSVARSITSSVLEFGDDDADVGVRLSASARRATHDRRRRELEELAAEVEARQAKLEEERAAWIAEQRERQASMETSNSALLQGERQELTGALVSRVAALEAVRRRLERQWRALQTAQKEFERERQRFDAQKDKIVQEAEGRLEQLAKDLVLRTQQERDAALRRAADADARGDGEAAARHAAEEKLEAVAAELEAARAGMLERDKQTLSHKTEKETLVGSAAELTKRVRALEEELAAKSASGSVAERISAFEEEAGALRTRLSASEAALDEARDNARKAELARQTLEVERDAAAAATRAAEAQLGDADARAIRAEKERDAAVGRLDEMTSQAETAAESASAQLQSRVDELGEQLRAARRDAAAARTAEEDLRAQLRLAEDAQKDAVEAKTAVRKQLAERERAVALLREDHAARVAELEAAMRAAEEHSTSVAEEVAAARAAKGAAETRARTAEEQSMRRESEVAALTARIADIESALRAAGERAAAEVAALKSSVATRDETIANLEASLGDLRSAMENSLQEQSTEHEALLKAASDARAARSAADAKLAAARKEFEEALAAQADEAERLRDQDAMTQRELLAVKSQLARQTHELELQLATEKEAAATASATSNTGDAAKLRELQTEVSRLTVELDTTQAAVKELEAQVETANAAAATAREEGAAGRTRNAATVSDLTAQLQDVQKHAEATEAARKKLSEELSDVTSQLEEAKKQLEAAEAGKREARDELAAARSSATETAAAAAKAGDDVAAASAKGANLEARVEAQQARIEELRGREKALEVDNGRLATELQGLREDLESERVQHREALRAAEASVADVGAKLDAAVAAEAEAKRDTATARESVDEARRQAATAASEANARASALEAQVTELTGRVETLQEKGRAAEAARAKLQAELDAQVADASARDSSTATTTGALQDQLTAARSEIVELRTKVVALEHERDELSTDKAALEAREKETADAHRRRVEAAEEDLADMKRARDDARAEVTSLNDQIGSLEGRLAAQTESHQRKRNSLQAELDALRGGGAAKRAELAKTRGKLQAAEDSLAKAERQLTREQEEVTRLASELENARSGLYNAQTEAEEAAAIADTQLAAEKANVQALTDKAESLEGELAAGKAEVTALKQELATSKEESVGLQAQLEELQAKLDAATSAELKSEADKAASIEALERAKEEKENLHAEVAAELEKVVAQLREQELQTEQAKTDAKLAGEEGEKAVADLRQQLEESRSKSEVAAEEATKQIEQLNASLATAEQDLKAAQDALAAVSANSEDTAAATAELQKQLDRRAEQLAEVSKERDSAMMREKIARSTLETQRKLAMEESDAMKAIVAGLKQQLEAQTAEAEGAAKASITRVSELEEALSTSRADLDAARSELEAAAKASTARVVELEEAAKASATRNLELEEALKTSRADLDAARSELEATTTASATRVAELEESLGTSRADLDAVRSELEAAAKASTTRVAEMEEATRASATRISELEEALKTSRDDLDAARSELEATTTASGTRVVELEEALSTSRADLDAARSELEAKRNEAQASQEVVEQLKKQLQSTNDEVARLSAELEDAEKSRADNTAAAKATDAEIAGVQSALNAALKVQHEAEAQLATQAETITALTQRADAADKALADERAEVAAVKKEAAWAKAKAAGLHDQLEEATTKLEKLEEQEFASQADLVAATEALESERAASKKRFSDARAEMEGIIAAKDAELTEAQKAAESVASDVSKLRVELEQARAEVDKVNAELETAKLSMAGAADEQLEKERRLVAELADREAELNAAREELAGAEARATELAESLARQTEEAERSAVTREEAEKNLSAVHEEVVVAGDARAERLSASLQKAVSVLHADIDAVVTRNDAAGDPDDETTVLVRKCQSVVAELDAEMDDIATRRRNGGGNDERALARLLDEVQEISTLLTAAREGVLRREGAAGAQAAKALRELRNRIDAADDSAEATGVSTDPAVQENLSEADRALTDVAAMWSWAGWERDVPPEGDWSKDAKVMWALFHQLADIETAVAAAEVAVEGGDASAMTNAIAEAESLLAAVDEVKTRNHNSDDYPDAATDTINAMATEAAGLRAALDGLKSGSRSPEALAALQDAFSRAQTLYSAARKQILAREGEWVHYYLPTHDACEQRLKDLVKESMTPSMAGDEAVATALAEATVAQEEAAKARAAIAHVGPEGDWDVDVAYVWTYAAAVPEFETKLDAVAAAIRAKQSHGVADKCNALLAQVRELAARNDVAGSPEDDASRSLAAAIDATERLSKETSAAGSTAADTLDSLRSLAEQADLLVKTAEQMVLHRESEALAQARARLAAAQAALRTAEASAAEDGLEDDTLEGALKKARAHLNECSEISTEVGDVPTGGSRGTAAGDLWRFVEEVGDAAQSVDVASSAITSAEADATEKARARVNLLRHEAEALVARNMVAGSPDDAGTEAVHEAARSAEGLHQRLSWGDGSNLQGDVLVDLMSEIDELSSAITAARELVLFREGSSYEEAATRHDFAGETLDEVKVNAQESGCAEVDAIESVISLAAADFEKSSELRAGVGDVPKAGDWDVDEEVLWEFVWSVSDCEGHVAEAEKAVATWEPPPAASGDSSAPAEEASPKRSSSWAARKLRAAMSMAKLSVRATVDLDTLDKLPGATAPIAAVRRAFDISDQAATFVHFKATLLPAAYTRNKTEAQIAETTMVFSIFHHYASAGDPLNANVIGSNGLRKFVRESFIVASSGSSARVKGRKHLQTSQVDLILTRVAAKARAPRGSAARGGGRRQAGTSKGQILDFDQFCEAVQLLADALYGGRGVTPEAAIEKLLKLHINPAVEAEAVRAAKVRAVWESRTGGPGEEEVRARDAYVTDLLSANSKQIVSIFRYYCHSSMTSGGTKAKRASQGGKRRASVAHIKNVRTAIGTMRSKAMRASRPMSGASSVRHGADAHSDVSGMFMTFHALTAFARDFGIIPRIMSIAELLELFTIIAFSGNAADDADDVVETREAIDLMQFDVVLARLAMRRTLEGEVHNDDGKADLAEVREHLAPPITHMVEFLRHLNSSEGFMRMSSRSRGSAEVSRFRLVISSEAAAESKEADYDLTMVPDVVVDDDAVSYASGGAGGAGGVHPA